MAKGEADLESLSRRLGLHQRGARDFLDALVALDAAGRGTVAAATVGADQGQPLRELVAEDEVAVTIYLPIDTDQRDARAPAARLRGPI